MFAYHITKKVVSPSNDFKQWPETQAIASSGPYIAIPFCSGTVLLPSWHFKGGHKKEHADLSAFAPGVEVADGVMFHAWMPGKAPTSGELLRPVNSLPYCIDVDLSKGERVAMPVASGGARQVLFGKGAVGDVVDEYATTAQEFRAKSIELSELYAKQGKEAWSDADAHRMIALNEQVLALNIKVVALGLRRAYHVTDDVLDALGWITTADLEPLALAALGIDPLALECQE